MSSKTLLWTPVLEPPGPQLDAYLSSADELFYGGAAGGGKSDLLLGLSITRHRRSIVFRREFTQLLGASGLIERSREIIGEHGRYNGQEQVWRKLPGARTLEFGSVRLERDVNKYRGRPHDFYGFDEITEFTEYQYRFLIGWLRTVEEGQRCRVIAAGNPPSHAEGAWVIRYWAPWLDDQYSNPAMPGEIRYFAVIDGEDREVESKEPIEYNGETLLPRSRSFIPARLKDNPYLTKTGYEQTLQGLPEPLRSQLLYGDFQVGTEDDPWQVIPTAWVRLAFHRWETSEKPDVPLTCLGVDVARGGSDQTVLSRRYLNWFAPLEKYAGIDTPDGPSVVALVVSALSEMPEALVNIDVLNVGGSAYDILRGNKVNVQGINFARRSTKIDRTGKLRMRNKRAEAYWSLREALDPELGDDLAFPRNNELLADLTTPRWAVSVSGIQIEDKDAIAKRLGRSPDCGDAVALAALPKRKYGVGVVF